ncbi:MAG TPA: tetratricopeptide repeat protein [Sphingomicrobium sp.]|nr:tetratricopeptide repeat protein [Sphingomicrobium sp.]
MKLMITTAALGLLAVSAPAAAQMGNYNAPMAQPPQTVDRAMTAPPANNAPTPNNAQPGQKQIHPSSKAQKAIVDLQTAVNKNDVANIPAKLAAAQAVASTPDDRYAIGELQLKAAMAANNTAAMTAAVDAIASSGFVDTVTSAKLYRSLGGQFYNAKQFDQAVAAFQKAATVDPRDPEAYTLLGEAKFAQGQKAEAATDFQRAIRLQTASGQKPDEALLKRAVSVAYEAQSPLAPELGREWAAAYPSPDSWRNSIAIYRNLNHPDEEGTLDLLRLMQATNAMTSAGDYSLFAEAAAEQSNFNEAQAVLDAGIAARTIDPNNPQFRDLLAALKTKPKGTAADLQAAARMAPSTTNLLRIGDRYYGMGDYSQAADIYRQVLSKPDADKDVANLHLGMALARAGDKAAATAALNAVGGGRADIAKFWMVYVQQHA